MHLCQVTAHISSGLDIIAPPVRRLLTSLVGGADEKKEKPFFGVQKLCQNTEAHHIHVYKYAFFILCVL